MLVSQENDRPSGWVQQAVAGDEWQLLEQGECMFSLYGWVAHALLEGTGKTVAHNNRAKYLMGQSLFCSSSILLTGNPL